MAPSASSERKITVSFTNWILGGSLLQVKTSENGTHRRSSGRSVVVTEVDSDEEIVVRKVSRSKNNAREGKEEAKKREKRENRGEAKSEEPKAREAEKKLDNEAKKKDDPSNVKKPEEEKCKTCGKSLSESGDSKAEKKSDEPKASEISGEADEKTDEKTEEKKPDEPKPQSYDGQGSGYWTLEQDSKLKKMKETNASWKDIAQAVGHSKKRCHDHWKELQKVEVEKTKDGGEEVTEVGVGEMNSGGFGSGMDNGWDDGPVDGGALSFGDLFQDEPTTAAAPNSSSQAEQQYNSKKNTYNWNGPNDNGDDKNRPNNQHDKDGDFAKEPYYHAGEEGWSYKSNPPSHHPRQVHGRLHNNDVWSKDDCEILEILESQYREHKWLQIQAGFFNWTGRMISAELIEHKFREDGVA